MGAPTTSSEIKYYHCFFWRLMCLMWKVVKSGSSTHQVHHQSLSPSTNTILLRCSLFMFDFFQNALVFEALNLNYFYSLCLLRLWCHSFWRMEKYIWRSRGLVIVLNKCFYLWPCVFSAFMKDLFACVCCCVLAVAVLVNKLFNIDAFDPEFNKNCAFPSELLKSKRRKLRRNISK